MTSLLKCETIMMPVSLFAFSHHCPTPKVYLLMTDDLYNFADTLFWSSCKSRHSSQATDFCRAPSKSACDFQPKARSFSSPLLLPLRTFSMYFPELGRNLQETLSAPLPSVASVGYRRHHTYLYPLKVPPTAMNKLPSFACGCLHISRSSVGVQASQQIRQYSGFLP